MTTFEEYKKKFGEHTHARKVLASVGVPEESIHDIYSSNYSALAQSGCSLRTFDLELAYACYREAERLGLVKGDANTTGTTPQGTHG